MCNYKYEYDINSDCLILYYNEYRIEFFFDIENENKFVLIKIIVYNWHTDEYNIINNFKKIVNINNRSYNTFLNSIALYINSEQFKNLLI